MTMTFPPERVGSAIAGPGGPSSSKTKSKPKRYAFAFLAAVLSVGVGGAGWWFAQPRQSMVPISMVTVTRGDVEMTVLASGTLEASSLVSVGAQVSGVIESVKVKLGDEVKAGDVVAQIDSLNQKNSVRAAQAALESVTAQKAAEEANLVKYQKAVDRAELLIAGKLISQADDDTAQANVAGSEAQLKSLDAQIAQATLNVQSAQLGLDRTNITAPRAGTVVAVLVDEGQTVNATQSTPTIAKIADLATMQIKAEISEADVTRVRPGQEAYFTILGDPATKIAATLKSIEPAPTSIESDGADSSSDAAIYYNGIFDVPNRDRQLRIAMTAKVTIVLGAVKNVLTIPALALGSVSPDGSYTVPVLDLTTGKPALRKVTVGLNNKITAEVTSGLSEGDQIVSVSGPAAANSNAVTPAGPMGAPPMGL